MSRTVRRKNAKLPIWVSQPWVRVEREGYWAIYVRPPIDFKNPAYIESKREWHQDSHSGRYSPPSWWNNLYQRKHRVKAREELSKWMRDEEYEIILEDKPHRDYWW